MDTRDMGAIRARRCADPEAGSALVATLSVVLTLGVLVTIVIAASPGSAPSPARQSNHGQSTTTTVPRSIASGANQSAISACQADFQAIDTAIAGYGALNGSPPPAGTAWASSSANGGPYFQLWPSSSKYFAITWNGTILSVVPVRGAASHSSSGTSSPPSGCYAA